MDDSLGRAYGARYRIMGTKNSNLNETAYSRVFFGLKPDSARILKASRMVTVPVPLSSAPGDRPDEVLPTESWWAPTITNYN